MVSNFDNPSEAPVLSLVRLEKEPVHVGQLDFVVVEEEEFSDAAARQHLGRDAAHTTNAHHRHAARQKGRNVSLELWGSFNHSCCYWLQNGSKISVDNVELDYMKLFCILYDVN